MSNMAGNQAGSPHGGNWKHWDRKMDERDVGLSEL